jgi:hypothetical protein
MNVCADRNRGAWPRSHRGDRFERFRTSKQTGRNPPIAEIQNETLSTMLIALAAGPGMRHWRSHYQIDGRESDR